MKLALDPRARLAAGSAMACAAALWLSAQLVEAPLAQLGQARARLAGLSQALAAPPVRRQPLLPAGDAIAAPDRAAAARALDGLLRGRALRAGLLVESLSIAEGAPHAPLLEAEVQLSGPEPALLGFVAQAEQDQPLLRFAEWKLDAASAGGAVRLDARAVALWQAAR